MFSPYYTGAKNFNGHFIHTHNSNRHQKFDVTQDAFCPNDARYNFWCMFSDCHACHRRRSQF